MTVGRPNRDEYLRVRLTPDERKALEEHAGSKGMTVSECVRAWVRSLKRVVR